ncbi:hypothetical protein B0I35DRAFT_451382 [Stachybotrys elegans]|uniref:Zn(2)-C6 fungal-type domain-containing protein n=1 Tax=Stachybotrys elegans TaxID=80388 RepID=A0A8K0WS12_9HYPO|nr:hypothetical protein B0I35DRAFT_451382 [Stachybotrys elegans]
MNRASSATSPSTSSSTAGSVSAATSTPTTASTPVDAAKKGRRSKPKVKTGCTNCKQRRIKCDEKRPACSQCVRSKKACTGYPPPSRRSRPYEEIRIAPKPAAQIQPNLRPGTRNISLQPIATSPSQHQQTAYSNASYVGPVQRYLQTHPIPLPTVFQPSVRAPFNQTEALYYSLLCDRTANELSGYFDSGFWSRRVLQECHNSPAIRHAVVALGALYKTLEESQMSSRPGLSPSFDTSDATNHWMTAIKKYSEACKAVMVHDEQDAAPHRTRLMASVLLACFDSFIGDHKQAIIQMQMGLGMLHQLQVNTGQKDPSYGNNIEGELASVFTRLVFQAKSYDMAFHFPPPYTIAFPAQPVEESSSPRSDGDVGSPESSIDSPISYHFSNAREARFAADQLLARLGRFLERLHRARGRPTNVLPRSWLQYGEHFKLQLEAWSIAFDPVFQSRGAPGISQLEKKGIISLQMAHLNTTILFLSIFHQKEEQFDAFMPYFRAIVDLGAETVREDEARAMAEWCPDPKLCPHRRIISPDPFGLASYTAYHIRPSFSADLGIVPPLFVVATKCRDPATRRQAIQLLKSSARREAMWDSFMVAQVAEWVMGHEEGSAQAAQSPPDSLALIPDEHRVMITAVDFDLCARFANVSIGTRGVQRGHPDDRAKEVRLVW